MITHHYYEYFNTEGSHVATKIRQVEGKRIWSQGDMGDALLFGQNLFKSGGKYITITEGEIDAMSTYELLVASGQSYHSRMEYKVRYRIVNSTWST